MRLLAVCLGAILIFYCSCAHEKTTLHPTKLPPDICGFVDNWAQAYPDIHPRLVDIDTLDQALDLPVSIEDIRGYICRFAFTTIDQSYPFTIDTLSPGCVRFIPTAHAKTNYIEVCKTEAGINYLAGSRTIQSILSIFHQRFIFEPDGRLSLYNSYIDLVSSDTLSTPANIIWNQD